MNMRNSFGMAVAATAMLASPLAAQQASPAWSGFYAGLNAGGMWGTTTAPLTLNGAPGGFNGVGSGFVGGAQAGYNYLAGPVLLGGEIDFQGSTYATGLNGGAGPSAINATERMPWFSTMRLRAGYPVGSVMPYVTGGAVWGQHTLDGGVFNVGPFSTSTTFWTWTVGGGVEGMIADRWSLKLEYLYMGTPSTSLAPPGTTSVNESSAGNLIRIGANYHF
jgi:outer membrane immunogenic protein